MSRNVEEKEMSHVVIIGQLESDQEGKRDDEISSSITAFGILGTEHSWGSLEHLLNFAFLFTYSYGSYAACNHSVADLTLPTDIFFKQ